MEKEIKIGASVELLMQVYAGGVCTASVTQMSIWKKGWINAVWNNIQTLINNSSMSDDLLRPLQFYQYVLSQLVFHIYNCSLFEQLIVLNVIALLGIQTRLLVWHYANGYVRLDLLVSQ